MGPLPQKIGSKMRGRNFLGKSFSPAPPLQKLLIERDRIVVATEQFYPLFFCFHSCGGDLCAKLKAAGEGLLTKQGGILIKDRF